MKNLYRIKTPDLDITVIDDSHIDVVKGSRGIKESFWLDFSETDTSLIDDILKACAWLKGAFGFIETEKYSSFIEIKSNTNNVDEALKCIEGIYTLCHGEYLIRNGSIAIGKGYNQLEKYIENN